MGDTSSCSPSPHPPTRIPALGLLHGSYGYARVCAHQTLRVTLGTWMTSRSVERHLADKETEADVRRTAAKMFVCVFNVAAAAAQLMGGEVDPAVEAAADACMADGSPSLPALHISDPEGARVWRDAFGDHRVAVSFKELFPVLETHLGMALSASKRDNMRFVLDDAGCNLLTVFRYVWFALWSAAKARHCH